MGDELRKRVRRREEGRERMNLLTRPNGWMSFRRSSSLTRWSKFCDKKKEQGTLQSEALRSGQRKEARRTLNLSARGKRVEVEGSGLLLVAGSTGGYEASLLRTEKKAKSVGSLMSRRRWVEEERTSKSALEERPSLQTTALTCTNGKPVSSAVFPRARAWKTR
ncbi:hypothetical protein BDY24DRAFT_68730 [Mrakia frigida]|uniref:uncharacterized protein n=1 Tax=Mrakia frigida TaxID=29902 RepID=UPI003FCC15AC